MSANEHMVTELRVALLDACELLQQAKCPDRDCISGKLMGRLAENNSKCEWCAKRKALIEEHG